MKKFCIFYPLLALAVLSCNKAHQPAPGEDENAWVNDESLRVPVQFASRTDVETKAINYGPITGSVMNSLDVGVISVAEKQSDGSPIVWDKSLEGSILIDNLMVTTSETGEIVFSPKIYYPFGNQYAYSFYSYYPYANINGESASIVDGAYSITYDLGNTDILWANSVAEDYNGVAGYNAAYCRAVKQDGVESQYFPKLQYKHLLTAMVFKVVGKDSDIANYDVKVTGLQITNTSSKATLTVADSNGANSGVITGNEDGGSIGFTNLDVTPTATASELCTILAMPAANYTAEITLTVDGANQSTVELNIGSDSTSYDAGYIYYFTVTINNPQEVTIIQTGLDEWIAGDYPDEGKEI